MTASISDFPMTGRRRRWLAGAFCLLLGSSAWADPKDDARRHFVAGLAAAEDSDYERALREFLAARDAYPHPNTTFNIAQAYIDLGLWQEALDEFLLFQEEAPDRAALADDPIVDLRARLVPPQRAPETSLQPTSASATQDELDRLRALATELEELATTLATREPDAAPESASEEPASPPADIPSTGFLSDAYERIVITASRYGQAPLDSPSPVTIITADDIRYSGATSIPDVLRRAVGVDVMNLTSTGPSVGIRGFNSELPNKVLVLVDGRSIYWDFIGAPFWTNIPIALEEIERIEVIRGPGSAMYGANALTGVINIITRTPGEGPKVQASVSAGFPNLLRTSGVASGRSGGTSYRFSAGTYTEGRWAKDVDLFEEISLSSPFENQDQSTSIVRINGRVDQTFLEKGFLSLSGGYSTGNWEFYNFGALGHYGIDATHHDVRADVAWGPLHFRTFWNHDQGQVGPWLEPIGIAHSLQSPIANDAVDAELEYSDELETGTIRHRVHAGVGYRYKRVRFDLLDGGGDTAFFESHFKAFIQEELQWEWLAVQAAIRIDDHPLLTLTEGISPRGAAVFRVARSTSVRLGIGSAYRAPNHLESYTNFALGTSADGLFVQEYGGQTNTDGLVLGPERILTVELGAHDESSVYHAADASLYFNRITNLIDLLDVTPGIYAYDPESNGYRIGNTGFANRSDTTYLSFGGEVDLKLFPVDGLDLFTNVSVHRMLADDGETLSVDASTSLVKWNIGGTWRTRWTSIDLASHLQSAQTWPLREFDPNGKIVIVPYEVPSRVLLSARIGVTPFADQDFEIAATLWNPVALFAPYQEHPKGQPTGGRIFGSLNYRF